MARLFDDVSLRDRLHVFTDRAEAGRALARMLGGYASSGALVLAIPSGGVPVAVEIARNLQLPLDLLIVRKIQIPGNTEAGFGAVGPDGGAIFNERLVSRLGLTEEEIKDQAKKTLSVVEQRNRSFRQGQPFPDVTGRSIILVDDGLASGYTMSEAALFVKRKGAQKIVVAVPTAPERSLDFLLPAVDELYCANVRGSFVFAVADAYRNWYDLSDDEVIALLKSAQAP